MRAGVVIGVLATGTALAGGSALFALLNMSAAQHKQTPQQPADLDASEARAIRIEAFNAAPIPEFTLEDQDGAAFTRDDLSGGITVLDFMFTNCPAVCPAMTGNMVRIYEAVEGTPIRFVSVSVDPVHDTREALQAWADLWGVSTERWRFLRGDQASVGTLIDALGFALTFNQADQVMVQGKDETMANIIHPTRFVVFGPDGAVIDTANGMADVDVDALIERLHSMTAD